MGPTLLYHWELHLLLPGCIWFDGMDKFYVEFPPCNLGKFGFLSPCCKQLPVGKHIICHNMWRVGCKFVTLTIHSISYLYFVFLVNVSHSLDVIGTTILVMAVQHALFPDVAPPFKVKPLPQLIFPSGSTSKGSKVREWKFSSWGCFVGFAVLNVVNVSRMWLFFFWQLFLLLALYCCSYAR